MFGYILFRGFFLQFDRGAVKGVELSFFLNNRETAVLIHHEEHKNGIEKNREKRDRDRNILEDRGDLEKNVAKYKVAQVTVQGLFLNLDL